MAQTQTQANRNLQILQEIEQNEREIAENEAISMKIMQDMTSIGEMMRELDNLVKLQAPILGMSLSTTLQISFFHPLFLLFL